jgi:hypothetical protein
VKWGFSPASAENSAQIPVVGAGIDGGQILLFCGDGSVDAAAEVIYRF